MLSTAAVTSSHCLYCRLVFPHLAAIFPHHVVNVCGRMYLPRQYLVLRNVLRIVESASRRQEIENRIASRLNIIPSSVPSASSLQSLPSAFSSLKGPSEKTQPNPPRKYPVYSTQIYPFMDSQFYIAFPFNEENLPGVGAPTTNHAYECQCEDCFDHLCSRR